MNKTFKRIAAATLAAATLATTMISASAYDANATKYKSNPYELKTTVYTANGTLAYTEAQRAMYPTFTQLGIKNGIYSGLSNGKVQVNCGQRYMGVNEWAKKDGAIAAVFQYDINNSSWPGSVESGYDGYKVMKFGPDKALWPQCFKINNIGTRAAVLQYVKSAEVGSKYGYSPLVARVMDHDPVINDIDVIKEHNYYLGTKCTLQLEFDAAYMGMNVDVYIGRDCYSATLTDITPADERTGKLGSAVYTVDVGRRCDVNIRSITCYTNDAYCDDPMVYLDGKNDDCVYSSYWQGRPGTAAGVQGNDPNFVGGEWY